MTRKRRAPRPMRYTHQEFVNEFSLPKRIKKETGECKPLINTSVLNAEKIVTAAPLVTSSFTVTPAGPSTNYPVEQTHIPNSSTSMAQGTVGVSSLSQSGGVMGLSQLPFNSIHIAMPGKPMTSEQFYSADSLEGASILEVRYPI